MKHTLVTTLAVLVLTACAGDADTATPGTPVDDPVITIADMAFVDGTVTVEVGTTVTWVWDDGEMMHNVVFEDFESPLQAEGTYTHTFDEPGTFEYHCQPHPFMQGTVFVVEAGA